MRLDSKYRGTIIKNKDSTVIPQDEYIVFRPADNALPATLECYKEECLRVGAKNEQLEAVVALIERVRAWRAAHPERCKVPDVEPGELSC